MCYVMPRPRKKNILCGNAARWTKMSQELFTRRDLLKMLAASAGATALSTVPNKWVTPIVEIGALPAHAQGSLPRPGVIRGVVAFTAGLKPIPVSKPKTPKAVMGTVVTKNIVTSINYSFNLTSDKTSLDVPFNLPYSITVPAGTYDVTCTITGDTDILNNLCSSPPNPGVITGLAVPSGATVDADFFFDVSCPPL